MANVIQPDYRVPSIAGVTVQVEKVSVLNAGPAPLPFYAENVTSKDDPQGTIKSGKSGKGSAG